MNQQFQTTELTLNGISVIVCTYNGAGRIRSTLDALAKCQADFPVEIILVDNNSTDDTAAVAQKAWERAGNTRFAFRVVHEAELGLAFARSAGVRTARGDLIVFCDDDNWLAPDYLIQAVMIMQDSTIGALGGAGEPVFEDGIKPPPHFYNFATWLACGAQFGAPENVAKELVDLTKTCHAALFGAGLVVRRANMIALLDLPDFPIVSDRKGTALFSGGDYEICHLIALSGKRLVYSAKLRFRHLIPDSRLDPLYLQKLSSNIGHGRIINTYIAARMLSASGMSPKTFLKIVLRRFLSRNAYLDAFQLALLFDKSWLAYPDDRPAFRNVRAIMK